MNLDAYKNFDRFESFTRQISPGCNVAEMIDIWMREAISVHVATRAIYMKYIDSKKSLLVSSAIGFEGEELKDVGLDLMSAEPGFNVAMLQQPGRVQAIREFVLQGLCCKNAYYYPMIHKNKIMGVFIIPADERNTENSYLKSCLRFINSELEIRELKSQLRTNLIYENNSEVFLASVFRRKLADEVVRARRLLMPVSLIFIATDHYCELALKYSKNTMDKILHSVSDILTDNSRVNDIVGSVKNGQFLICLPHTNKLGAIVKAERLRKIFEGADFSSILGGQEKLSLSMGLCEYPSLCNDVESLLNSAEQSLYEAKKSGGNQLRVASLPNNFISDFMVADEKFL